MKNYKALIMELEAHIKLRDSFEISLTYWTKKFEKSGPRELSCQKYENLDMPRGGSDDSTLDKIVYNIQHKQDLIHTETEIINGLQECIDKIDSFLKDSKDIRDMVTYLKYQKDEYGHKKYNLSEIADMTGYSEDYIKEISATV
jgi:hypothetical protein